MNFNITIFSLLYVIIIIVPGVIFKRFYFQGQFSKQFGSRLFADRLITSIFLGLVVQIITFLVFSNAINKNVVYIFQRINEFYASLDQLIFPVTSPQVLYYCLFYLFLSVILAILLGHSVFILTFLFLPFTKSLRPRRQVALNTPGGPDQRCPRIRRIASSFFG